VRRRSCKAAALKGEATVCLVGHSPCFLLSREWGEPERCAGTRCGTARWTVGWDEMRTTNLTGGLPLWPPLRPHWVVTTSMNTVPRDQVPCQLEISFV
jgi:hypothetical protein